MNNNSNLIQKIKINHNNLIKKDIMGKLIDKKQN